MIHSLLGKITFLDTENAYMQTGAIEWHLFMSGQSLKQLRINEEVRIYTYLLHKEELMQLFGFYTLEERDLFFNLIKVEGIGPKAAIKILGFFDIPTFKNALESADAKTLAKAPGLGLKTAQKIILNLKGKLNLIEKNSFSLNKELMNDELLQPLTHMGFDRKLALQALTDVRKELGKDATEGEILRKTINLLS